MMRKFKINDVEPEKLWLKQKAFLLKYLLLKIVCWYIFKTNNYISIIDLFYHLN